MKYYEEIYDKYGQMVYRYLYRLCQNKEIAEDLTQDTFIRAIEKSKNFQGQSSVSTWLCAIARNTYLDYLKKKENQNLSLEFAEGRTKDFIDDILVKDDVKRVHKILHKMSEPYKEVFMLRVFGELSFKDIAGIFGKTEVWARVTYRRAREKLINELREK